jgi:glycosyltransferase involved in cell wall biosynthesis
MKILMTTDNIGGVWRYALSLARGLKKLNIDVVLVITGFPLKETQLKELKGIPYYFIECKQEWMEDPWQDQEEAGEWLLKIAKKENPDFVHLNSLSFGALPWEIPVITTVHSCVTSWWAEVKKERLPKDWQTYKAKVGAGLRASDVVVAPSKWMMNSAIANYGIKGKTKVIYNGLNPADYFVDTKEDYVFSMGRLWDEGKNIQKVLKAATFIDNSIYIAGENSHYNKVQVPENVYFTGFLSSSEVSGWLSNASVYLLPVKYEPFGYTFLEAALSGCVLITGDIPTMHEIWDDAAVYVDPDNDIQIAFEINRIMEDQEFRQYMGAKAQARAARYTLENMLREYVALYHQIMNYTKKETKTFAE